MTSLKASLVYTTTDGQQFPTHAAAKKAQDTIDRKARVEALVAKLEIADGVITPDVVAYYGKDFIEALTIPSGRAPRTAKVVAA